MSRFEGRRGVPGLAQGQTVVWALITSSVIALALALFGGVASAATPSSAAGAASASSLTGMTWGTSEATTPQAESPDLTPQAVETGPDISCASNAAIFDTGYNAATGGILANGSRDSNWQVSQQYPFITPDALPANPTYNPAIVGNVAPGQYSASPYGNANWISSADSTPNQPGTNNVPTVYYYQYQFNLDSGVDASSFSLLMNFLADNEVDDVFVNGVSQAPLTTDLPQAGSDTTPGEYLGYKAANAAVTTLNHDWVNGENTIVVEVVSDPPQQAFDAQIRPSALCPVSLKVTTSVTPSPYVPGLPLTYTVKVTNGGPGTATDATLSDALTALSGGNFTWTCAATNGSSCTPSGTSGSILDPDATVTPGGTLTYTVTGTVPRGTTGTLSNTATIASPNNSPDSGCPADCTATATDPPAAPTVSLTKSAVVTPNADSSAAKVGDTISYAYTVKNTGNVALESVAVNDPTAGKVTCAPVGSAGLAVGASASCSADAAYVVTQADVDAGQVTDTATATGDDEGGNASPASAPASVTVPTVKARPALSLAKTANDSGGDSNPATVGETIQYSYVVTNTGNVDLTSVGVSDPTAGATTCNALPAAGLAPGATVNCSADNVKTVSQSDIDNGGVFDTATASGVDPSGTMDSSGPAEVFVHSAPTPEVSIQNTATVSPAADQSAAKLGDTIQESYVVTNIGNTTLSSVTVNDPTAGAVTCAALPSGGLAPGGTVTCTANATSSVTQADVDAGKISDTATATGTDLANVTSVSSNPSTATVRTVAPIASDSVTTTGTVTPAGDQSGAKVGDTIAYSYVVTNTGNVDLSTVSVIDPAVGAVNCPTPAAPGLAPGQSETCTASVPYKVTQSDVDAGSVSDTVAAGCVDAAGLVCATSAPAQATNPTQAAAPTVTVQVAQKVEPAADAGKVKVGDDIMYTFTVTNTGDVTLTSVEVNDPNAGSVSCPTPASPGLAPGGSETCTADTAYEVTQLDVDNGSVVDTATATGTDTQANTSPASAPSTVTETTEAATPGLTLKAIAAASGGDSSLLAAGETIQYSYLVMNTGDVSLSTVGITDTVTEGTNTTPLVVTCPSTTLGPGQSETCTANSLYTVKANDNVSDAATATGTPPSGTPTTATSSVALPSLTPAPTVSIATTAATQNPDAVNAGDVILYSYVVTNTGNTYIGALTVTDPTAGPVTCNALPSGGLAPGGTVDCAATNPYSVTQAEVDSGGVTDTATASGVDTVDNKTSPNATDSATVYSDPTPVVSVVTQATVTPTADANGVQVGDTISYSYVVTNVGNDDLKTVSLVDPTAGAVTCPVPAAPGLAPGASETCTANAPRKVTQADVDTGSIVDTATATGVDSQSNPSAPSSDTTTVKTAPADPMVSITPRSVVGPAADQGAIQAGDTVQYSYVVTNTGNVDLTAVSVTDPSVGTVTCPTPAAPGLAPGASETCVATAPYAVTQSDVDNGAVVANATAIGIDSSLVPTPKANGSNAVSSNPVPRVSIVATGTVDPSSDQSQALVGDEINYSYVVTNTSNVTLASVAVSDPSNGAVSCPTPAPPGLAPGASETCTGEIPHVVTQADANAGSISSTATATGTDTGGRTSATSGPSTVVITTAGPGAPAAGPTTPSTSITTTPTPTVPTTTTTTTKPKPRPAPKPAADLGVNLTADTPTVAMGANETYTIVVTNHGPDSASKLSVTDKLPPGLTFVSASKGCVHNGGTVTCKLASLGPHAPKNTATFKVVTHVGPTAPVTPAGSVTVSSSTHDPKTTNNHATRKIRVLFPVLKLSAAAGAKSAPDGGDVGYTFTLHNAGRGLLSNAKVCDALPSGTTLVSAKGSHVVNGEVCWVVKRLKPGQTLKLTLSLNLAASTLSGELVNRVTATARGVKTQRASVTVDVIPGAGPTPDGVTG